MAGCCWLRLPLSHWALLGAAVASSALVTRVIIHKLTRRALPSMQGRLAVVTGANTGIGFKVAEGLARSGARVIMACRSLERGEEARAAILRATRVPEDRLTVMQVDMSSLRSVAAFHAQLPSLHLLVNNAGVMLKTPGRSADRFEMTLATNYLGPWLLTNLMLPNLAAAATGGDAWGARVVHVGSRLERRGDLRDVTTLFRSSYGAGEAFDMWEAYATSKTALLSSTFELHRQLEALGSPIKVANTTPGMVNTDIVRWLPGWMRALSWPLRALLLRSPQQGADAVLAAATEPGLRSGAYTCDALVDVERVSEQARDPHLALKLWDATLQQLRPHGARPVAEQAKAASGSGSGQR